jgi:hypothetical protein
MNEPSDEQLIQLEDRGGNLFLQSTIREYKVWRIWRSPEGEYWLGLNPLDYGYTTWFGFRLGTNERFLHFDIKEVKQAQGSEVNIEDFIRALHVQRS